MNRNTSDMGEFLDYDQEEEIINEASIDKNQSNDIRNIASINNNDVDKSTISASSKPSEEDFNTPSKPCKADDKTPASASSLTNSVWGKFTSKTPASTPADSAIEATPNDKPKIDFSGISSMLSEVKNKRESIEHTRPPLPTPPQSSNGKGFRTLMVSGIPAMLFISSKIENHFTRYGKIAKVECDSATQNAFVTFEDASCANRAFVNAAPVFRMTSIAVYSVRDHAAAEREAAIKDAVRCPNRKLTEPLAEATENTTAATESVPAPQQVDPLDLYSNINKVKTASTVPGTTTGTGEAVYVVPVEKRTWSRAGLPNMNDKEVLKAKIKEKQAALQVNTAKDQVRDLMKELNAQKQQLELLGKDSKSVGKQFKQELMTNIRLLMVQLKHAEAAMVSAKNAVTAAKAATELAIENSKTKEEPPQSAPKVAAIAEEPTPEAAEESTVTEEASG